MSVSVFEDSELAGIWHELIERGAPAREALYTLTVLGLANRAAYALQYDEDRIFIPKIESASPQRRAPSMTLEQCAKNLLYHCMTNGGTDFAPQRHVYRLKAWAGIAVEYDEIESAINLAIEIVGKRDGPTTEAPILLLARMLREKAEYAESLFVAK